VPAVEASTVIVAGLAVGAGCSEPVLDLLQPKSKISEISAEEKKILPRINADKRGSKKSEMLRIQAIDSYGLPIFMTVALSA